MGRLLLILTFAAAALGAADVTGKWNGPMETNGERMALYVTLRQVGQSVTGTLAFQNEANPFPIENPELHDSQLTFEVHEIIFRLTVAPDAITGQADAEGVLSRVTLYRAESSDPRNTFEGGADTPPILIRSVEPAARGQGTVKMRVEVGPDGKVGDDIRVVQSLGDDLDRKAIEAAKQYRFKPATHRGHPVAAAATIEVNFRK